MVIPMIHRYINNTSSVSYYKQKKLKKLHLLIFLEILVNEIFCLIIIFFPITTGYKEKK
jgi:hypothetical protein